MENIKTPIADSTLANVAREIISNGMGNPIILTGVPTNATMKANTWGIWGTDIYIKCANNVTLKLTGTNVP